MPEANQLLARAVAAQLGQEPSVRARPFSQPHSATLALYYVGVLAVTFLAFHPVVSAISLAGALLCAARQQGLAPTARHLASRLPLALLVAAANPLFSASGSTLLFKLGPISVYLESLAWGACLATVLVASLTWFGCAAAGLTQERLLGLFGGVMPTTALALSLTARLVPQLVRRGQQAQEAARACTAAPSVSPVRPAHVLVGWALEDSLVAADSMRARGWGATDERSRYRLERFGLRDALHVVLVLLLLAASAFLVWVACTQFRFYPRLSRLVPWWGYLPWTLYVALGWVLQGGRER